MVLSRKPSGYQIVTYDKNISMVRGKGGERMIFGIVFLCGAAVGVAAYRWGMQEGIKAYEQGMNRQKYGSGL